MAQRKDEQGDPAGWEVLSSDELFSHAFFRFRKDRCALPNDRIMPAYYVMEFVDWVNVVPLTDDGQIVLVDQYRHAARKRFYEFPGGTLEAKLEESPEEAARRELLEETGYVPGRMLYLGLHYPNPGLQDNRMHVFLATGCTKVSEPALDAYEDLEVELVPVPDFMRYIEQGRPMHSLMMASFVLALPAINKHLAERATVR